MLSTLHSRTATSRREGLREQTQEASERPRLSVLIQQARLLGGIQLSPRAAAKSSTQLEAFLSGPSNTAACRTVLG